MQANSLWMFDGHKVLSYYVCISGGHNALSYVGCVSDGHKVLSYDYMPQAWCLTIRLINKSE